MTRPSPSELLAETARLAYHFHWSLDTVLDLEHGDRRTFLEHAEDLAERYSAPVVAAWDEEDIGYAEPAEPEPAGPAVDLEAIEDPQVRRLFATYFGGA